MSTNPLHCKGRSANRPQISIRFHLLLPSLVNTRRTLVNARASLVHTLMSCLRTICELRASRHSDNRPQISIRFHMVLPSLVNTRRTLVNARASLVHTLMSCLRTIRELPASRHSNNRPQISFHFHMVLPSLVNARRTLVNARASLVHTLMSCLRTIRELPASRHSNNRPQISFHFHMVLPSLVNARRTLVNARASLVHTLMSCLRTIRELPASRHSNNRPQISFHFHMVLPSLVNARKRSCNARTCAHELPAT